MEFSIASGVAIIKGAFYPAVVAHSPCMIICHGMPAGPKSSEFAKDDPINELSYGEIAQLFADLGIATVIFNFRGTGLSTGDYHPLGWVADLESVLAWVVTRPEIDPDRIGIMGSSMGGVIALKVASSREDLRFLVSYASPSSTTRPADPLVHIERYRSLGIITTPGFPDDPEVWSKEYDAINPVYHIDKINSSHILLVHGDADDVVPVQALYDLAGIAPAHTELRVIEGAGHRFRSEPRAIEVISRWVDGIFSDELTV